MPEPSSADERGHPFLLEDRLQPVPRDAGFRQKGYYVWGGSLIEAEGRYHLFASRWPETTEFPDGYRTHSEIVRATASAPLGPYTFEDIVLSGRGGDYWDGKMCHNPKIVRIDGTYVLYYIGSAEGSSLRKIGYARADAVEGPWRRCDAPLPLGEDANNPAPLVHEDGSVLLAFRDRALRMHVARADAFDGSYAVVARDIFPAGRLEDPELWRYQDAYHMVVEDNEGVLTGDVRHGGHLVSSDGVDWSPGEPVKFYSHTVHWADGTVSTAARRERPALFSARGSDGHSAEPTHLLTSWLEGGTSWCLIQPIAPVQPESE